MEDGQSDMKFASDPTPFAFTNESVDGGYYVLVTGVENREFNMRELRFCIEKALGIQWVLRSGCDGFAQGEWTKDYLVDREGGNAGSIVLSEKRTRRVRMEAVSVEPFAFELVDAEVGVVYAAETLGMLAVQATACRARC